MNQFVVKISDQQAHAAFKRAPSVVAQAIDVQLARGVEEVAREAKQLAPKFQSLLINSISASHTGLMQWEVAPGVNYAQAVEEGTGPAAGRARYFPNVQNLFQVLSTSPQIRRFSWKRAGSMARGNQEMQLMYRAHAWAWHIYNHGTPAQPYMLPALENKRSRLIELVQSGANDGAKAVFG
ncbi:MAG: hypothetical protein PHF58_10620 [Methylotenera sp.]|nr:hypothetical protein [Methylotenera sp.]